MRMFRIWFYASARNRVNTPVRIGPATRRAAAATDLGHARVCAGRWLRAGRTVPHDPAPRSAAYWWRAAWAGPGIGAQARLCDRARRGDGRAPKPVPAVQDSRKRGRQSTTTPTSRYVAVHRLRRCGPRHSDPTSERIEFFGVPRNADVKGFQVLNVAGRQKPSGNCPTRFCPALGANPAPRPAPVAVRAEHSPAAWRLSITSPNAVRARPEVPVRTPAVRSRSSRAQGDREHHVPRRHLPEKITSSHTPVRFRPRRSTEPIGSTPV